MYKNLAASAMRKRICSCFAASFTFEFFLRSVKPVFGTARRCA